MTIKELEELRDRLCEELEEYNRELKNQPKNISASMLEHIHRLTDTIKNVDKIIMLHSGGYDDENSYARRGEHYVRGHYSHNREMSERRDERGRYSRDGGKERMIEELRELADGAETDRERSAIRRCIEQIEEG